MYRCELDLPLVLVVANKITSVKEIMPVLELVKKTKRSLVVFSEDLQQDPLSMMVYNNNKDTLKCCAVNVPWTAGYEKDLLTDLAVHTGATVVDNGFKLKLEQVTLDHFGSAKKIVIDGNTTHIVGGSGTADKVQERLREIKEKIDSEPKNHMKQVHKDRYSRM